MKKARLLFEDTTVWNCVDHTSATLERYWEGKFKNVGFKLSGVTFCEDISQDIGFYKKQ